MHLIIFDFVPTMAKCSFPVCVTWFSEVNNVQDQDTEQDQFNGEVLLWLLACDVKASHKLWSVAFIS